MSGPARRRDASSPSTRPSSCCTARPSLEAAAGAGLPEVLASRLTLLSAKKKQYTLLCVAASCTTCVTPCCDTATGCAVGQATCSPADFASPDECEQYGRVIVILGCMHCRRRTRGGEEFTRSRVPPCAGPGPCFPVVSLELVRGDGMLARVSPFMAANDDSLHSSLRTCGTAVYVHVAHFF